MQQLEVIYSPYTMYSNNYVYVVISKKHPLTDVTVFSASSDIALLTIDESKYQILKLPIISEV